MADLESKLRPVAESLLAPGETLLGTCVATQQKTFKGWMVAIVVTPDRLVLQKLTRKFEPRRRGAAVTRAADRQGSASAPAAAWAQIPRPWCSIRSPRCS